jgi:hypothetical protein
MLWQTTPEPTGAVVKCRSDTRFCIVKSITSVDSLQFLDWIGLDWIGLDWIGLDLMKAIEEILVANELGQPLTVPEHNALVQHQREQDLLRYEYGSGRWPE